MIRSPHHLVGAFFLLHFRDFIVDTRYSVHVMQNIILRTVLIALLFVTAMGAVTVANACGGGGIHNFFGLGDCPQVLAHHLDVFMTTFAATVVALALVALRFVPVAVATLPRRSQFYDQQVRLPADSMTTGFDSTQELLSRGIIQR